MKDYRIYDDSDQESDAEAAYGKSSAKKRRRILLTVLAMAVTMVVTLVVGNPGYSASEVLGALIHHDTGTLIGKFVWNIDMPIMVAALVSGAGLALAGVVMQCILKNPLASPYTLGLSNAAAFGAAFSIIFLTDGMVFTGFAGDYVTPLAAFAGAMVATVIILVLTKVTRVSAETMVLAGIAVSAIFSAGMTLMQYIADPVQLSSIVSWTFGSVSYATWGWDGMLLIVLMAISAFFMLNRWNLNAIDAGDEVAKGLGVNTDRFLVVGMVLSAVLAAAVVSKFGVIAFVGLLAPHMARLMVGDDHRHLIPMSIALGALLLLVANTVALNIALPRILPVGLLTSLLGGPAFIFLLVRRYRR